MAFGLLFGGLDLERNPPDLFFSLELHFQIQVWILLISWPGASQKLRGDGQWMCCAAAREDLIWFLLPCLISRISFQNLITSQNSF
jgi:hypothetical protein